MKKRIRVIAALSGLTLVTIHMINKVITSTTTSKEVLDRKFNNYFEWRFGKIRYQKKGSGKPIVLIHNLTPGSSSYEFHKIFHELAKTNEVYVLDLLGYGLSDKPNLTYTNFLYVELISDFIKNVVGKKADIITSGDSSSIAVMTCQNNPEIINKMIFINPQDINQLKQIPGKKSKLLKLLIDTPIIGTFVYNIFCTRKNITNQFLNNYFSCAGKIESKDIDAYVESAHLKDYSSKYAISSYLGKYMNINILHALVKINHSMYIISGMEKINAGAINESYLKYNGAIEYHYIQKTKLLPQLEKPEETSEVIRMYLDNAM